MTPDVRTFRAGSMRAALELLKRELGPDAVILGTRSVAERGLGRLIGRDQVEITAAPAQTASPAPRLATRPSGPAHRGPSAQAGAAQPPASASATRPPSVPEEMFPYFVELVQNEVAEDLAARVLRAAVRTIPASMLADGRAVREVLRRCIARLIPPVDADATTTGARRRLALLGPPGSGKTSTAAKLAAHLKLRRGATVALLSLDSHRLGADEHLRRYADVIGVPFESAQSVGGVAAALQRLPRVDWLLIDTPGVSPGEEDRFEHLSALMTACRPDETHLVLPACQTASAQTRIGKAFASFGPSRVVLTHLDETVGMGVILNVVDRLKLGVSYLAAGQNVPNHLKRACGDEIAMLILPASH